MLTADSGGPPPDDGGWIEPTLVQTVSDQLREETATVLCRYCQTPAQTDQVLCGRCGMKLPVWKPAQPDASDERLICQSCGTASAGDVCRNCGVRIYQTEP